MAYPSVLITRPEHDKITRYLSELNEEIILEANKKGITIKDLQGENANRTAFESFLKKQKPSLVFLNGHGDAKTVHGHKNEPLLKYEENEKLLKGTTVYALACDSATTVGHSAVKQGTTAYIGYTEPFSFLTNKNKECRPKDDELANSFKEASNQVGLALLNGKTPAEAYARSQLKFKELMQKFSASNAPPEAEEIRFWLFWNMQAQTVLS
mgnify:FL=1